MDKTLLIVYKSLISFNTHTRFLPSLSVLPFFEKNSILPLKGICSLKDYLWALHLLLQDDQKLKFKHKFKIKVGKLHYSLHLRDL